MRRNNYISYLKLLFFRIILIVVPLLFAGKSFAQQDPMYTQYMENMLTINPAYAGSKDLLTMMIVSRNQWVSMPGAPITRTFEMHSPVTGTNTGLGLSVLNDQIGPVKQTGIYFDYSYTLNFSNKQSLALGLKAGVNFFEAGLANLTTNDPNDPVFANDISRKFLPNFGVGAFFHTDRYYLGLSIPKLIENDINKSGFSIQNITSEQMHIFFIAGYVFDVNRIVKFKPSILTKYVKNTPVSVNLDGTFLFYDRLWLGAMYRVGDSFGGLFQIQVTNQLKIGYSYDLPINALGAYNGGTHEIMVTYDFNLGKGKVRSPRYF
ncbi:MAG TPA: type IX secretion system membrane protein PorP/SprF [Prolixibacteraceae bacterium]